MSEDSVEFWVSDDVWAIAERLVEAGHYPDVHECLLDALEVGVWIEEGKALGLLTSRGYPNLASRKFGA